MESAIEKCTMLIIKSEKRYRTKGMELLNQEKNQNVLKKCNFLILVNI